MIWVSSDSIFSEDLWQGCSHSCLTVFLMGTWYGYHQIAFLSGDAWQGSLSDGKWHEYHQIAFFQEIWNKGWCSHSCLNKKITSCLLVRGSWEVSALKIWQFSKNFKLKIFASVKTLQNIPCDWCVRWWVPNITLSTPHPLCHTTASQKHIAPLLKCCKACRQNVILCK